MISIHNAVVNWHSHLCVSKIIMSFFVCFYFDTFHVYCSSLFQSQQCRKCSTSTELELTRMAIQEMGSDDLLLGAICMFLEPCDLHHLLLLHLKTARKPGLTLGQGALGCDGLRRLHKHTLRTAGCRDGNGQFNFCIYFIY